MSTLEQQNAVKRKREDEVKEKEARKIIVRTCGVGGHECICGAESAKGGKDGVVGATVLWLVCDAINKCVGRLESMNGVKYLQDWIDQDEESKAAMLASHKEYEKTVLAKYLPEEKAVFFTKMHSSASPSPKYGNAGTSVPDRVKCLHAHTATYIAGIPTPIGSVVGAILRSVETLGSDVDIEEMFKKGISEGLVKDGRMDGDEAVGMLCKKCEMLSGTFSSGKGKTGGRKRKKRLH